MNSVILIGRLTRDPELRYTPNTQTAVAHFTLAIDRPVSAGQERQADFIRITVFGKQARDRRQIPEEGQSGSGKRTDSDGKLQRQERSDGIHH